MINGTKLRDALKGQVRALEADLRERFGTDAEYAAQLSADWKAAHDARRTAEALYSWVEGQFTQSAVAWVLACVFVRFCEDNDLLDAPLIAGNDGRGQGADQRQQAFYLRNPTASDNDYLRDVFATASRLPGLSDVLKVQSGLLAAPVSADMGKQLLRFFRASDPDTGSLLHDFADEGWNTRFLGDLYQDLSEAVRDRFALFQTPEYVESFILDRTLTPALDVYALEEVDLIDPACGSGHFLLGAFERLAPLWLRRKPESATLAIQEALNRISGVDLNPYAVAIARFRLLIAALGKTQARKLRLAPDFRLHIETGDSLLHGFDQRDYRRLQSPLPLNSPNENLTAAAAHLYRHAFAAEDLTATSEILARKYTVVVGNPPYIAVKDRALSALYRERFSTCHGKYALVAPFCERFWALAKPTDAAQRAGYVGLIVGNAFMKRSFGKKLVQAFFPTVDLTHVLDTAGAYIPGHGTPTAILFGRSRPPSSSTVRVVMGIKGEPGTPVDAAKGIVWRAIVDQVDLVGSETAWVSVADLERAALAKHPWSIGGGGVLELRELIEGDWPTLKHFADEIGVFGMTNADEVMLAPKSAFVRREVEGDLVRELVVGDAVRDWAHEHGQYCAFPYRSGQLCDIASAPGLHRWFWPYRTVLGNRATFSKDTYFGEGRPWWEWHQIGLRRLATPSTITLAFVATHNHFALDEGGKVFNRSAPIVKLKADASDEEHLGILGLLNSSSACFWFKQVLHNKGSTVDQHGARQRTDAFEDFYEFTGAALERFPVPADRPTALAKSLHTTIEEYRACLPVNTIGLAEVSTERLRDDARKAGRLLAVAIALQEELDWQVYAIFGLIDGPLCYETTPPEIKLGERAFEIALAQDVASGSESTTWFERHGSTPVTELPGHWPSGYRLVVQRRIDAIRRFRDLALVERPEYKRRWTQVPWDRLEKEALKTWVLDRLEADDLWPRDPQPGPRLRSLREIVDTLSTDESFRRALDLYAGAGADAHTALLELVNAASVPYLDALRYTESGQRKHAVWLQTWALQRREDKIDAEVSRDLKDDVPDHVRAEQVRRRGLEVGVVPVPPKYKQEDFRDGSSWKLRGSLDVPKERFVSFPGLERVGDAASPIVLWAGYDARARALALTGYLYEMQRRESTHQTRLVPVLAGLDEMLPWVHQWHPEVDDDLGMSTGDYLQGLLDAQLAQHGLSISEVRAWQPLAPVRRTRGRRSATT